ncbi:MAG TPA: Holliday junction resolvase RuvX [Acidimicrobiales bacterium]
MRALGLDLGEKRIGVALSSGSLATPYEVVHRSGSRERDHAAIARLAEEAGAELIVVGLPLSLDGTKGPAARTVEAEAEELRVQVGLPVELWDERLSTVEATRRLGGAGVRGRKRRHVIDQVAATVILQSWLDANPSRPDSA